MPKKWTVIFQNQNFIAVDKPVLFLTTPPRFPDERPILGREIEKQLKTQVWPIHRLDYEVSGLVLFALSAKAHRAASLWFEQHFVRKTYEAFTEAPDGDDLDMTTTQFWRSRLLRGKKRAYEHTTGKKSITYARPLEKLMVDDVPTLKWQLNPQTGRPHQLRYELSKHGFPILGDTLYGSKAVWPAGGIALRSVAIEFLKPQELTDWALPTILTLIREGKGAVGGGLW